MTILEQIIAGIAVGILSSLLTFTFKTIKENENMNKLKASMEEKVEKAVRMHKESCAADVQLTEIKAEIQIVRTALTWIVVKSGGNLKELGLS